jgi:hypothetical protein
LSQELVRDQAVFVEKFVAIPQSIANRPAAAAPHGGEDFRRGTGPPIRIGGCMSPWPTPDVWE